MQNLYNPAAVAVLFAAIVATLGCPGSLQLRNPEKRLRQELLILRSEIGRFTLDHQRPPDSLSQLVATGYLKEIPTDPVTGSKETWKVEKSGNRMEVHSGSDGIAIDGSPYRSW
jgi:general secretion pathway protein G